jgi:molecular chaperone DnaK
MKLTRAKLESLVEGIVSKCKNSIDTALSDAKLKASDIDKIILVGGPTRMPIVQRFVEEYVGKKVERGIDPMECVAHGAAIQAAILTGEVKDVLLLDVTPLSLGIETLGGVMTKLIEKNTTIPVRKTQIFSTATDNQPAVTIHVLQGERPLAKDNVSLGKFDLDGIPPAPRGVPQIEVTFDIDANGILKVSAKDLGTGKSQHITISAPNKLSKEEIEKYIKEAEKYAEQDKKMKELIEAKNEADSLIYTTEKALREHGDKISNDERLNIERAINDLKEAIKTDDTQKIRNMIDNLIRTSQKLGEAVYKANASAGNAAGSSSTSSSSSSTSSDKKDDVVDAEVVDDKKNNN